jgi:hypothetical protein
LLRESGHRLFKTIALTSRENERDVAFHVDALGAGSPFLAEQLSDNRS